jgi:hypothetical protein
MFARLPWMVFVLLFSLRTFALDLDDRVENIKIIKVFPGNIVALNLGYPDGVEKGAHAKLFNVDGYVARALCLRANDEMSHWRLYRIVDGEKVSKDYTYTLRSMQGSEPDAWIESQKFKPYTSNPDVKTKTSGLVKTDLPKALTTSDDPFAVQAEKSFWQKHFGKDVRSRETENFTGSFFGSPLSRQSINDAETFHYGFDMKNKGRKYDLYAHLDRYQAQMRDATRGGTVRSENTLGVIGWEVKNLTPYWSAFTETQYSRIRYGEAYTPRNHYLVGLVGFKYLFKESRRVKNFSLSYLPIYESRLTEVDTGSKINEERRTGIRHGVKAEFDLKLHERFHLLQSTWFRPKHDFTSWGIDTGDAMIRSQSTFSLELGPRFYMDYIFVYMDDQVTRELSGLSRVNTIQTVDLRYFFEI